MIKATDLMIGNYVNEYILGDVCVNEIYENSVSVLAKHMDINKVVSDIAYTISCSNLIGIPLTPDVLERLGFKYDEFNILKHHILKCRWITEKITGDKIDVCFLRFDSIIKPPMPCTDIYHVHQLQNLYKALTGKDLTFKTT